MPNRGSLDAEWVTLCDKWPSTLNKDAMPESLAENESPDAYGLGLDKSNALYYEASPSVGTAWAGISTVSAPTYPPATCTWRFFNNRLFGYVTAGGTTLYYGAYGYDSHYMIQDLGYVPVDYENSNITNVIPFGNNVAVFKDDYLYVIRNADSSGSGFVAELVKQASGLPVAGNVISMDGVLVWLNTHGLFAYDGQSITELSYSLRSSLAPFVSSSITSLTGDFEKKRVIGLSGATPKFILQLGGEKPQLFDYSTSGFKWTSKTLVAEDAAPIMIDKVCLVYQYSASDRASVTLGVKVNDTWKTESAFAIRPGADASGNGFVEIPLTNVYACRKFALKITDISSSFYISSILVHLKQGGVKGYATK